MIDFSERHYAQGHLVKRVSCLTFIRMHYTGRWDGIDCSGQMFGSVISPLGTLALVAYHLSPLLLSHFGENLQEVFF